MWINAVPSAVMRLGVKVESASSKDNALETEINKRQDYPWKVLTF